MIEEKVATKEEKVSPLKLNMAQYFVVALLVILAGGLWRLQVVNAEGYRTQAEQNRVRKVPIMAPRGKIFDREGRLLVDNYASVSCYLLREPARDWSIELPMIAQGLHMTVEQIESVVRKYQFAPKYQPIPLKQDISPDEIAFIEAHRNELPELETLDEQRRLYPKGGFAAHLIGYVGEISENDLNREKYAFYQAGDVVGKSGVEATYDAVLRGTDGARDVIVDSRGHEVGQLGQQDPVPGQDLRLAVDLDLQVAAEKAMEGKSGAMVAIDPHTGEVLAMVSRPTYDPNQFAVRLSKEYWNQILKDPDHPMMNKAIQAQLAPGSTFKIIMSYAGLEEGVAQDMHVNCSGGGTFFGHFFGCDLHHGAVNIHNAIPLSCDTFYYTLAERLQIDTIAKYAASLGIGQKTGIDLPDEVSGTMPSTAWKLKNFHDKWYAGEVISVGIGQGAVQASPVQLARALSGIASGGSLRRPHVLLDGQLPAQYQKAIYDIYPGSGDKQVPLQPENWQIITDAMAETLNTGTAATAHLEGIDFIGKTGTAQVMSHLALARSGGGKRTVPNSWFVGMTPRRNPDIVVAVLWENGNGGWNSAKLAAQVVNTFVEKQRRKARNLLSSADVQKQKGNSLQNP
ncbi:penicillin-binding protein 2 [Terriglobus albidus]|uniref:Penicillin-binding protein 2 n=1 Tax=Terriglobus albidus TaxID=1592106 RepID=A0A5B9EBM4_9BACT|nr:penicillin-binding protein 2 [Terriglobus albidus]QEE27677.1 penicillin-binding protein 2 [Terriglobus albidus]